MLYILVVWTDNVQEFMEYPWFKTECHLCNPSDEEEYNRVGSSAYFIPWDRYNEVRPESTEEFIRILMLDEPLT